MIQTADGALNEIQAMLQRMRELSVQAASDTLTAQDRIGINGELSALKDEVNGISARSTFNEKQLLTGSLAVTTTASATLDAASEVQFGTTMTPTFQAGLVSYLRGTHLGGGDPNYFNNRTFTLTTTGPNTLRLSSAGMTSVTATVSDLGPNQTGLITCVVGDGSGGSHELRMDVQADAVGLTAAEIMTGLTTATNDQITLNGGGNNASGASEIRVSDAFTRTAGLSVTALDIGGAAANASYQFSSTAAGTLTLTRLSDSASQTISIGALLANATATLGFGTLGISIGVQADSQGATTAAIIDGLTVAASDTIQTGAGGAPIISGGVNLQVGASASNAIVVSFERVDINATSPTELQALHAALAVFEAQHATSSATAAAQSLIGALDNAVGYVSAVRSDLGATQNRLQFTHSNLGVAYENLLAAGSRIEDADLAGEMVRLTQSQMLGRTSAAILSQANQQLLMVLSLLR